MDKKIIRNFILDAFSDVHKKSNEFEKEFDETTQRIENFNKEMGENQKKRRLLRKLYI